MNLVKVLESQAKDCLDKIAIIEEGKEVTYRELWQRVDRLAKAFLDLGIKEGDRVAIYLPNCQEYIYAFLASLKINAIAVPLKQALTSYELKTLLKDSKPSLLITDDTYLKRKLPFDLTLEAGKLVICSKHLLKRSLGKRAVKIEDLFKRTSGLETTFAADDNTVASINYTYRGYGYPLGAMLTHGNFQCGIYSYISANGLGQISVSPQMLLLLPLSHIFPLMVSMILPLYSSGTVIISKYNSPAEIIKCIGSNMVDVTTVTPTLVTLLLKNHRKAKKTNNFVYAFCGGAPMTLEIYQEAYERLGIILLQGYGLTECLVVTTNTKLNNFPETLGSVVIQNKKINIIDEKGDNKKMKEIGEIAIGGDTIMAGYLNHKKETADVLKNGWCHSGDYGYFDENGLLHFTGLKKQITKVGGNMVDLVEVKNTIKKFPSVIETKINSMPDEIWGNVLNAEVLVENPKEFDMKRLRSFLRDRLSSYKVPHLKIIN